MPLYECTFIARQDISSQAVNSLKENFCSVVSENGGTVVRTENWGLRNLSHRVKKNRKGHYVMLGIDVPYDVLRELERSMRYNEDVIRYASIAVNNISEEPSPLCKDVAGNDNE